MSIFTIEGAADAESLKGTVWGEMRAIWYTVLYDVKIFYRYPANLAWLILTPLIFLFLAYAIKDIIDLKRFSQFSGGMTSLAPYILSGFGVYVFSNTALQMIGSLEREIVWGTLIPTFVTPIPRLSYISGLTISSLLSGGLFTLIMVAIAFFLSKATTPSFTTALLSLLLGLAIFFGIGIAMCGLSLRFKRIGQMVSIITFAEQFFTGIFIPVLAIPMPFRVISYLIPTTWVIDSFRSSLLGLSPILPIEIELIILLALAITTNSLGMWLFKISEKKAREGGLDIY